MLLVTFSSLSTILFLASISTNFMAFTCHEVGENDTKKDLLHSLTHTCSLYFVIVIIVILFMMIATDIGVSYLKFVIKIFGVGVSLIIVDTLAFSSPYFNQIHSLIFLQLCYQITAVFTVCPAIIVMEKMIIIAVQGRLPERDPHCLVRVVSWLDWYSLKTS